MGRNDWVSLNDYSSIKEALVKQGNVTSARPDFPAHQEVAHYHGIIFSSGDLWQNQRRFGITTLRECGFGKRSLEERIVEEVSYLNDAIRATMGKPFEIMAKLGNAISNNICSVAMGRRYDYDNKRFKDLVAKRFNHPRAARYFSLTLFEPLLIKVPPISTYNKMQISNSSMHAGLFREIIDEHRATFDKENIRDFIDAFLERMAGNDPHFTEFQLLVFLRDLFIAGTETTTSTLRWALLVLLHNPGVQDKLRNEIHKVIGQSTTVSMAHRESMPYTRAFIEEIYRYRTLTPLDLFHETSGELNISGYKIPKNTVIIPNLWAVHNDPDVWDEPSKFKPERHLDEKGNFVQSKHVIPFSVGPRHCLGEQLARMEIFIFLVSMVQKFEFLPDPNEPNLPEINHGVNATVFVAYPFNIV
uniref:Uncharacterized protein n=1 Tax=Ciona intestinalis TaxID=7719 RepID=H2XZH7_CIOIN